MADYHECINTGDQLLREHLGTDILAQHQSFQEFQEFIVSLNPNSKFSKLAEYLPTPKPTCTQCSNVEFEDVYYLIIPSDKNKSALHRFRVYINSNKVVCVETDFGFKNPY